MPLQNSSNQKFTNNADGFVLGGGTTQRNLTVSGANVTLTGSGSNTHTLPASSDTLVGRASTDALTNKIIDANNNTITNIADTHVASSAAIAPTKLGTGRVISTVNGVSTSTTIWRGTQAQYNSISTKDDNTLYFISG